MDTKVSRTTGKMIYDFVLRVYYAMSSKEIKGSVVSVWKISAQLEQILNDLMMERRHIIYFQEESSINRKEKSCESTFQSTSKGFGFNHPSVWRGKRIYFIPESETNDCNAYGYGRISVSPAVTDLQGGKVLHVCTWGHETWVVYTYQLRSLDLRYRIIKVPGQTYFIPLGHSKEL